MLKSINTSQTAQVMEKKVANLLVSLGSLAIENYAQIILNYNDQLTSDIKRTLTLVVNNLQICSQLKSRVLRLQEKINPRAEAADVLPAHKQKKNKRLKESLARKEEKLAQLNEENINLLLQVGNEFNQLYQKLAFLTKNGSDIKNNIQEINLEDVDLNPLNLTSLLSASRH